VTRQAEIRCGLPNFKRHKHLLVQS
jgi:hypothetical protein